MLARGAEAPATHIGTDYAPAMPTPRKTPQHTVVIDNDLWQHARRIAAKRHEKISDVIRQALVRYVQRHGHLDDTRPALPQRPDRHED